MRLQGGLTVVDANTLQLVLLRVLSGPMLHRPQSLADTDAAAGALAGTWAGESEPQPLVLASVR